MSEYEHKFYLKINVGHGDLYFTVLEYSMF